MERPKFTPESPTCWCTVCGRSFYGPDSFDLHRGIKHRHRREDGQDAGQCADFMGLYALGLEYDEPSERWGSSEEVATSERMAKIRSQREPKRKAASPGTPDVTPPGSG